MEEIRVGVLFKKPYEQEGFEDTARRAVVEAESFSSFVNNQLQCHRFIRVVFLDVVGEYVWVNVDTIDKVWEEEDE